MALKGSTRRLTKRLHGSRVNTLKTVMRGASKVDLYGKGGYGRKLLAQTHKQNRSLYGKKSYRSMIKGN